MLYSLSASICCLSAYNLAYSWCHHLHFVPLFHHCLCVCVWPLPTITISCCLFICACMTHFRMDNYDHNDEIHSISMVSMKHYDPQPLFLLFRQWIIPPSFQFSFWVFIFDQSIVEGWVYKCYLIHTFRSNWARFAFFVFLNANLCSKLRLEPPPPPLLCWIHLNP